ncbi:hypothetical protein SUGI_0081260 [Cryptomeria japonica]|nr:hypothetical protein SUGI_0081260 [Cryptomeria japonica]
MNCKGRFIFFLLFFTFVLTALSFNDFQQRMQTDAQALLQLKMSVKIDPTFSLSNWVAGNYVCNWTGINCNEKERVESVVLKYKRLNVQIPPHMGNMSFLTTLDLSNNYLSGPIPAELSLLHNLERLVLGSNNLTGVIPQELENCSALKTLDLGWNLLTGRIPSKLGALRALRVLNLEGNRFSGEIPKYLSNCTRLRYLLLSRNMLEGPIPEDIGYNLPKLQEISMHRNNLSGTLPKSIWNCSALYIFRTGYNNLSGVIPRELGLLNRLQSLGLGVNRFHGIVFPFLLNCTQLQVVNLVLNRFEGSIPIDFGLKLTNLQRFCAGGNLLSGEIPKSLGNCSQLSIVDLGGNRLSGVVPQDLGMLTALEILYLGGNNLSSGSSAKTSVFDTLTNCSHLRGLDVSQNHFSGTLSGGIGKLPPSLSELYLSFNNFTGNILEEIGNLTALTILSLGKNNVTGEIQKAVSRLKNLQWLDLSSNKLQGSIPPEFSKLINLAYLWLGLNNISGEIPSSIGSLQQLRKLDISCNDLTGRIPDAIGQCFRLEMIDLSYNSLIGNIPMEISNFHSLAFYLNFSHNSLTGRLPSLGVMQLIQAIDISANELSGPIPGDIGSCVELQYLNFSKNQLNEIVPTSIGQLKSLEVIDLSFNNLLGPVPHTIANLSLLRLLNFSYNNLNGLVPNQGAFRNLSTTSFLRNPRLCAVSGWLNLPNCTGSAAIRSNGFNWKFVMLVSIGTVVALCCILGVFYILFRKNKREPFKNSLLGRGLKQISNQELHSATEGFNAANLLWAGSFGSVYRGLLSDNTLVAVKVFDQDPPNSYRNFYKECRILRKIRHRNLVKVLSCCSTPGFRALVLQFMSKGSLEQQLHQDCRLSLEMRLNIALDVAHALAYLHHDCSPPVVHCDLKPSNVLMDENMTAHVADFGIACLMTSTDSANSSTSRLKGTVGYLAPEYGLGAQVTTKSDVYSFGVVILEMVTRRRPTDDMFTGNRTLPSWVRAAFPKALDKVLDREVQGESKEQDSWLTSLIGLGLQCTRYSPGERPTMREVEGILERIVYGASYGNLEGHPSVQSLLTSDKEFDHRNSDTSFSSTDERETS